MRGVIREVTKRHINRSTSLRKLESFSQADARPSDLSQYNMLKNVRCHIVFQHVNCTSIRPTLLFVSTHRFVWRNIPQFALGLEFQCHLEILASSVPVLLAEMCRLSPSATVSTWHVTECGVTVTSWAANEVLERQTKHETCDWMTRGVSRLYEATGYCSGPLFDVKLRHFLLLLHLCRLNTSFVGLFAQFVTGWMEITVNPCCTASLVPQLLCRK